MGQFAAQAASSVSAGGHSPSFAGPHVARARLSSRVLRRIVPSQTVVRLVVGGASCMVAYVLVAGAAIVVMATPHRPGPPPLTPFCAAMLSQSTTYPCGPSQGTPQHDPQASPAFQLP